MEIKIIGGNNIEFDDCIDEDDEIEVVIRRNGFYINSDDAQKIVEHLTSVFKLEDN